MKTTSPSRLLALLATLVTALFAPVPAPAQTAIYGIDYNGGSSRLFSIDANTWSATLIGSTGQYLEDIAISPAGELFATSTSGDLYKLNVTTAAATLIGSTGRGNIEALDFNGNTLLGFALGASTLFSIDTTTGSVTDLVTLSLSPANIRAMAIVDSGTLLIRNDGSPMTLSSVNISTGAITSIGSLSGSFLYGMDFGANGTLYAFDYNGSVYSVNTSTGATTLLGTSGSQWLGVTIQAVPEPATCALLALGGGLLFLVRRRRRA